MNGISLMLENTTNEGFVYPAGEDLSRVSKICYVRSLLNIPNKNIGGDFGTNRVMFF